MVKIIADKGTIELTFEGRRLDIAQELAGIFKCVPVRIAEEEYGMFCLMTEIFAEATKDEQETLQTILHGISKGEQGAKQ